MRSSEKQKNTEDQTSHKKTTTLNKPTPRHVKGKGDRKGGGAKDLDESTILDGSFQEQAQKIWKYVLKHNPKDVSDMADKFKPFYAQFPETINWMVHNRIFNQKAFEMTVKKRETAKRTKEDFYELQAYYAKHLYINTQKHYDVKRAGEIYRTTYSNFKKAHDDITKQEEEFKAKREEREKQYDIERRQQLKSYVDTFKNDKEQSSENVRWTNDIGSAVIESTTFHITT